LEQPAAVQLGKSVGQLFAQTGPRRVTGAEFQAESRAANFLDSPYRLPKPSLFDLAPQTIAKRVIKDSTIESLDEMEFIGAVRNIDVDRSAVMVIGILPDFPHQRGFADPSRSKKKEIVCIEIAPEGLHLIDTVEKVVASGDGPGQISHSRQR
jgi:hypothetical protein